MSNLFSALFSLSFLTAAVIKGIPLLCGAVGEILIEKSGNLNLGIPGIMYLGAIGGITGAYFYEHNAATFHAPLAIIIALLCSLAMAVLGGLIFSFLTITLRVNQNVTGLALTTFGTGLGNFLGASLSRLAGTSGSVSVRATGNAFKTTIPFLSDHLGPVGRLLFSYSFLTYFLIAAVILAAWFLSRTRQGLSLRAVGENPGAADAAGISVTRTKYLATLIGSAIAGLGGLYYIMAYLGGVWQNDCLGDTGWLSIALVIFALWKPARAIWGAILFGGLCVLFNYLNASTAFQEILKMLPYVCTIIMLIASSLRMKRENQPPASLGLAYFREDR